MIRKKVSFSMIQTAILRQLIGVNMDLAGLIFTCTLDNRLQSGVRTRGRDIISMRTLYNARKNLVISTEEEFRVF